MSYTKSKRDDYVGGSNENMKNVYNTIYADRFGAKFSNIPDH